MLQTVRAEKVFETNGVIFSSFHVPFLSYGPLIVLKSLFFLQCCSALSKKSKFTKAVYIFAYEVSLYELSENGMVCYAVAYCFGNIRV